MSVVTCTLILNTPISVKSPDIIKHMLIDTSCKTIICGMSFESTQLFDFINLKFTTKMKASTMTNTICIHETHVLCGGKNDIKIYDKSNGKIVSKIKHKCVTGDDNVYSVIVCNNSYIHNHSPIILSSSNDNIINMWDFNTGKNIGNLNNPKQHPRSTLLNITNNSGPTELLVLYNAINDYGIDIIDIATNKYIRTLEGHTAKITCVQASNNGQLLISSSRDKTIKLWNTTTWNCIKTLSGHKSHINSIFVSPDNKLLSSTDTQHIHIWDIQTGECLKTITDNEINDCPAIIIENMIIYGTITQKIKLIPFTIHY